MLNSIKKGSKKYCNLIVYCDFGKTKIT